MLIFSLTLTLKVAYTWQKRNICESSHFCFNGKGKMDQRNLFLFSPCTIRLESDFYGLQYDSSEN